MESKISPYYLESHIAQYIHGRATDEKIDIKDLTKEAIYEAFKQDNVTKKQIDNVLGILTSKGIIKKRLEFDIYIPENSVNKIPETERAYIKPSIAWQISVGYFISMLTLISIPNLIVNINTIVGISTWESIIIFYSALTIISSFIIGHFTLKLGKLVMAKVPIVGQNKDLIVPVFMFLIPISIVYVLGIMILQETVIIGHILTIVAISVAGAVGYWTYKKKKKTD